MESAVTVREILEKETLAEAKIKRNLSSAKKYKALAWEQLAAYELAHRTQTAEATRLLSSLEEKSTLISSLRKTYADKREQAVAHVVSTLSSAGDSCENSFALYRRRDPSSGGNEGTKMYRNQEIHITNQWVVPYSPFLLMKYASHINVEYCHSIRLVKYLFKYQMMVL